MKWCETHQHRVMWVHNRCIKGYLTPTNLCRFDPSEKEVDDESR